MQNVKVNCILISTIMLWASAFVGIRIALAGYSPGALALLRYIVASLCLAMIYHMQDIKKRMPWRDRVRLLLAGMAGIGIYNICLNYGEVSVSAGIASFIIGMMPVMTVLLSILFLGERIQRGIWVGIVISILGLLILTLGESAHIAMRHGILLILISTFCGSVLNILQKQFLQQYHPIAIISWVIWGGTLLLLMFLPQLIQDLKTADVISTTAVIYMGIFPAALAYLAWGYVLKSLSASTAATSLYALPLMSTLLGFVLLHEKPSVISLIGGGIALLGALIANRAQGRYARLNVLSNEKVVAV
ncbi:MAG: DMT family transporter [Legionella sp.]|nr:DMT family transporter [Legionella sp.]